MILIEDHNEGWQFRPPRRLVWAPRSGLPLAVHVASAFTVWTPFSQSFMTA